MRLQTSLFVASLAAQLVAPTTRESTDEGSVHTVVESSSSSSSEPSACVNLLVYGDVDCNGSPLRSIMFPTWSKKGSPCYHDATMPNYSINNQRCDLRRGVFHQDVYSLSNECETNWFTSMFSPQEQEFSTDRCTRGLRLDYCVKGPCPYPINNVEALDVIPSLLMRR